MYTTKLNEPSENSEWIENGGEHTGWRHRMDGWMRKRTYGIRVHVGDCVVNLVRMTNGGKHTNLLIFDGSAGVTFTRLIVVPL